MHALAHSFLEHGANGISFFNFTYYRDYSFNNPGKLDRFEPPYAALQHIADPEFLAGQPKHYYIGANSFWSREQSQLPAELSAGRPLRVRIHVADAAPEERFSRAILRLMSERAVLENTPIRASLEGDVLAKGRRGKFFIPPSGTAVHFGF